MGHTFSSLLTHVVFSTKHRKPWLREPIRDRLYQYLAGIARNEVGNVIQIGGIEDHVHMLVAIKPSVAVSDAVGKLKALSSRWIKDTFGQDDFAWQVGYSAFGVSESNRAAVVTYIANQEEHHRRRSFREELQILLERHGIAYELPWLDGD
jgi:putative transposase